MTVTDPGPVPAGELPAHDVDPEALRTQVAARLARARARSTALTDAVDEADLVAQHSPLMSPLVWDLAHIGSQEELWLVRDVGGREPLRPEIDGLYDAFRHSRASRVELPLLTPGEAREYVAQVRDKALDALGSSPLRGRRLVEHGFAFGMIVQHEQQHDETMLATHQLRTGDPVLSAAPPPPSTVDVTGEALVPGGPFTMGTSTEAWVRTGACETSIDRSNGRPWRGTTFKVSSSSPLPFRRIREPSLTPAGILTV